MDAAERRRVRHETSRNPWSRRRSSTALRLATTCTGHIPRSAFAAHSRGRLMIAEEHHHEIRDSVPSGEILEAGEVIRHRVDVAGTEIGPSAGARRL